MASRSVEIAEVDSVSFAYPIGWTREINESDDGVSVDLQSDGVMFALVGIYPGDQEPDDLMEQAIESLRENYPGLETEELFDEEDDEDAVVMEATFLSLDMIVTCWLRGWRVGDRAVMLLVQSVEQEAKKGRMIFNAISRSFHPVREKSGRRRREE